MYQQTELNFTHRTPSIWICEDCGKRHGIKQPTNLEIRPTKKDNCDFCGMKRRLMHYRHYGNPSMPKKKWE